MSRKYEPLKLTDCAICGKPFMKQPGHMYKVKFAGKIYNCCSYSCYIEAKKVKENTREKDFITAKRCK